MLELTKENFEEEVLKATGKVFVDFYGDGCVPCQALMPFVHGCADKYGDKLKFTVLNTSKARRLAISQQVLGLPVMAVYENGVKLEELVKEDATEANIETMINRHI
ncbi:MAG: thioredoxin family protein [Oscillospiraceae bacterium]|nr:thioredoxin family protein [Oscillospiraceae bacterium]